ncbi:hypothetical protein KIL84_019738 [Mauremys mutica]|uniref:Uncharacterized protein n=1 Tax=Mauremys mutica TaxID=74926 RepID=A0A9D4BBI7_9SAUR|nr:hypothetical protein KIL84_019738 [Mauremys mutica]
MTVTALTMCRLFSLSGDELKELLEAYPEIGEEITKCTIHNCESLIGFNVHSPELFALYPALVSILAVAPCRHLLNNVHKITLFRCLATRSSCTAASQQMMMKI